LWKHEFLNVLSTYVQCGGTGFKESLRLWEKVVGSVEPCEQAIDMALALETAIEHKISSYDAQFVVLACSLGTPLVTEDRKLLKAFPRVAISMRRFCASG
jgi:predicted nucleic acid-binding protein